MRLLFLAVLVGLAGCQGPEDGSHWEWWRSLSGEAQLTDAAGVSHPVWITSWRTSSRRGPAYDLTQEKPIVFDVLAISDGGEVQLAGKGQVKTSSALTSTAAPLDWAKLETGAPLPEVRGSTQPGQPTIGCAIRLVNLRGTVSAPPESVHFGEQQIGQEGEVQLELTISPQARLDAPALRFASGWRHSPLPADDIDSQSY